MRSIRAAVAAAVLIIPGLAFAATSEPSTPEKSTAEQVRPAAESDAAQQPIRESGSDSFAQVPAAAPHELGARDLALHVFDDCNR